MTLAQLKEIVNDIRFMPGWWLRTGLMGDGFFIQAVFMAKDNFGNDEGLQRGRKWYVSPYAIPDEVVKTAWAAFEMALKHEAMEQFRYRGTVIFNPHTDVEVLRQVADQTVYREAVPA